MTEAPAFRVPTINVGDRQRGRLRCASILDVPPEVTAVLTAIERCLTPEFRRVVRDMPPLYGGGGVASRVLAILKDWNPPEPPRKVFEIFPLGKGSADRWHFRLRPRVVVFGAGGHAAVVLDVLSCDSSVEIVGVVCPDACAHHAIGCPV